MSGIIGSKFNHRGSGLVGSLGTDGQHMLSSGAGKKNVFETVTASGVTEAEGTAIRQDVLTLALKQAVQENSTKFNLTNSSICKFEADADFNLAGSTSIGRNASEYVASVIGEIVPTEAVMYVKSNSSTDGSTSFTDSSSENETITAGGTTDHSTDQAKIGTSSIYNAGTAAAGANKISVPHADTSTTMDFGTGAFTLEGWYRFNDVSRNQTLISQGGIGGTTTYQGWSWHYNAVDADNLRFRVFPSNSSSNTLNEHSATVSLSNNTWYHIAITRSSSGDIKFYLDGVMNAGGTSSVDVPNSGGVDFRMGTSGDGTWGFDGYMDNILVCKGLAKYSATFTPPTTYYGQTVSATGTALGTTNVPSSAVTDVSGVMLLKNAFGTNTLGTDVKAYFTADNSAWTEAASYADAGTFSTGIKMIKLGKTTCTSGSDVRWKIVWANQVASSKEGHIYGIGLNY